MKKAISIIIVCMIICAFSVPVFANEDESTSKYNEAYKVAMEYFNTAKQTPDLLVNLIDEGVNIENLKMEEAVAIVDFGIFAKNTNVTVESAFDNPSGYSFVFFDNKNPELIIETSNHNGKMEYTSSSGSRKATVIADTVSQAKEFSVDDKIVLTVLFGVRYDPYIKTHKGDEILIATKINNDSIKARKAGETGILIKQDDYAKMCQNLLDMGDNLPASGPLGMDEIMIENLPQKSHPWIYVCVISGVIAIVLIIVAKKKHFSSKKKK